MTTPAQLPKLYNPNLTADEVRVLTMLIDLHVAKDGGTDLWTLMSMVNALFKTIERAGGDEFFEALRDKFETLYDIVGCNCTDPDCPNRRDSV